MLTEANNLIYEVLKNGDLKISLTPDGQELITERTENGYDTTLWSDLTEDTAVNGSYAATTSDEIGGLTTAPMIISVRDIENGGEVIIDENVRVWFYEPYMIKDEFAELLDKGFIIFTLAQ